MPAACVWTADNGGSTGVLASDFGAGGGGFVMETLLLGAVCAAARRIQVLFSVIRSTAVATLRCIIGCVRWPYQRRLAALFLVQRNVLVHRVLLPADRKST